MRRGGGVGYDFSRIPPARRHGQGHGLHGLGALQLHQRLRPVLLHRGERRRRRGAQMGVLRIDHPDVHDFITAKRTPGRWNNFNVSVGVPDTFMQAVESDGDWELVHAAAPAPMP